MKQWTRSLAVKGFGVAFVGTHIPLLALVAVVALRPDWLTPWGVLGAALAATVLAAVVVIGALWRLLQPLRDAADGLVGFMTRGDAVQLSVGAQDEVGRLMRLLVHALAHVDRARAPLLQSGGVTLDRRTRVAAGVGGDAPRVLALLEVDQWKQLDAEAEITRMADVQVAFQRRVQEALRPGELLLPWGRGRLLVVLDGTPAQAFERLEPVCQRFHLASGPQPFSCSAVVEARSGGTAAGWASALNRLEQRLFAQRLTGAEAAVA
jgi:hypothetical protein